MQRCQLPGANGLGAVSILTRPEGRVQLARSWPCSSGPGFQSSPGPRVGCNEEGSWDGLGVASVSILTRPEGRVQRPAPPKQTGQITRFQSSPGPRVGCNPAGLGSESVSARFNPHPARGSGATSESVSAPPAGLGFQSSPGPRVGCNHQLVSAASRSRHVSILTRPEGRVQRAGGAEHDRDHLVSILTRPEGRVQRSWRRYMELTPSCFNPHPARGSGATGARSRSAPGRSWFQSSPGPRVGCNVPLPAPGHGRGRVSILTRPEGRVQRR